MKQTSSALFVCYPKCSTCMKAKRQLDEGKLTYEMRDIKADRPTVSELTEWIAISGLPIQKFFNTSGLIYKEKNLKQVLPTMTDEEKIELLASDGMLVKRPILVVNNQVILGYKEEVYGTILNR